MEREQYKTWVYEALVALGGRATIVDVTRQIWKAHGTKSDLMAIHFILGNMISDGERQHYVIHA